MKKYDTLSILGLFLILLAILFSRFNFLVSYLFIFLFIIIGFFIIKKGNNRINPKKYFLILLLMFGAMMFVVLIENLDKIIKTNNKLIAFVISFSPSIIYYLFDIKKKR